MTTNPAKCGKNHAPSWVVTYDIGKNRSEDVLVCKSCFGDPDDDCFRLFVISKTEVAEEAVRLD